MKSLKFILLLLLFSINLNVSIAQLENLTFEVRVQNFTYIDDITHTDPLVSGLWNEMQYDLYIQQTNIPQNDAEKMRFALGQYYWNVNLGDGLTVADTTGGYATYSYIPGSTTFTNTNAVPTSPSFLGISNSADIYPVSDPYPKGPARSQIRTNSNVALGNTSDVQVSTIFPGTRIGRYKLRRKAGLYFTTDGTSSSQGFYTHMRFRQGLLNVNSSNPFTKIFAYNGLGGISTEVTYKGTYIMDTMTYYNPNPNLILSVIPQGYYNPLANRMYKKAYFTFNLRSSASPYPIVYSNSIAIDSLNFTGSNSIVGLSPGSYYLSVTHWNSIETWSRVPINFNNSDIIYNFTDSINKAYGNNQKLIDTSPLRYGIFNGNVNQDAIIDAADLSMVENDAEAGMTGNVQTDVTGDNFVDGNDLAIVENNALAGIIQIVP